MVVTGLVIVMMMFMVEVEKYDVKHGGLRSTDRYACPNFNMYKLKWVIGLIFISS